MARSNVLNYLMQPNVAVVFDIDGVMAPYEFGELRHNGCPDSEWEQFVENNKPYSNAKVIPQILSFIQEKGVKNVYACSVSEDYEKEDKGGFVSDKYGLPSDHIIFTKTKDEKLTFLKSLSEKMGGEKNVAMVEDTVKTLNQIYDNSNIITVHISSFFFM